MEMLPQPTLSSSNYGNDKADELAEVWSKLGHAAMTDLQPASGRASALQFGTPSEIDRGRGRNSREKERREPRLQYKRRSVPKKRGSKK